MIERPWGDKMDDWPLPHNPIFGPLYEDQKHQKVKEQPVDQGTTDVQFIMPGFGEIMVQIALICIVQYLYLRLTGITSRHKPVKIRRVTNTGRRGKRRK